MAKRKKEYRRETKRKVRRERKGDKMIITTLVQTTTDAIIDFNDILEACEIVVDEHRSEPPWEDCDGYEHTLRNVEDEEPQYNQGHTVWFNRRRHLVVIDKDKWEKTCGNFAYFHHRGYATQVARQMEAEKLRRTYEQLVKWYRDGWEYWGVKCEYLDAEASVWGIDDYAYANDEERIQIAQDVACQLKRLGYDIVNTIDYTAPEVTQDRLRWQIAHNLGFKTPKEYRAWLTK